MDLKRFRNTKFLLVAIIVTVILSLVSDRLYFSELEWERRTSGLNRELTERESRATGLLNRVVSELAKDSDMRTLIQEAVVNETSYEDIIYLAYTDDQISYWSDNSISFPQRFDSIFETHDPVFISNGWYVPIHMTYDNYDLVALICVYRQFSIENNLLRPGFPDAYRLPEGAGITFDEKATPFHITGLEGEFHFGLQFPDIKPNTFFIIFPVFLWVLFLIQCILIVSLLTRWLTQRMSSNAARMTGCAVMGLLYILVLIAGIPASVKSTELFSPLAYSAGPFFPSLGHLFLTGILIISMMSLLFRDKALKAIGANEGRKAMLIPLSLTVPAFFLFMMAEKVFIDIILKSDISFEAYKVLDLSFMSIAGFATFLLLLAAPVFLFIRAFLIMSKLPLKHNLIVTLAGSLIIPLAYISLFRVSLAGLITVIVLALTLLFWTRKKFSILSLIILFAGLTGIYSVALITKYSDIRENENLKVLAVSLSNDNDLIAESLLIDLWPELSKDSRLEELMRKEFYSQADINMVFRYIQTNYFRGYWDNYDLNIVICRDDSPLQIPERSSYASNCFLYFDERIRSEGDSITDTGFWFMHNQSGRAYYLSRLFYRCSPFLTNGLFIELVSQIEAYQAGYPELLLDASRMRFPKLKDISYARYSDTTLVLSSGDYPFENVLAPVDFQNREFKVSANQWHKRFYYKTANMTLVIITDSVSALDMVVAFAYLFITTLILAFVLLLIFSKASMELLTFSTFRRRVQLAFATVLSIVFAVVIIAALVISIAEFKGNHISTIRDRMTSVSIELDHKLSSEQQLTRAWGAPGYNSLDELLVKFSNVFMTDINLYSASGDLLATSRPEIFSEKLQGTMINPQAFKTLSVDKKQEYIGEEKIGDLKYLSAYIPFYNENNQLLAYINLPYFSMQNLLAGEISNLIVTLINFTLLLLILMMWLAVFLSERLTSPLKLLQRAMESVEYGRKNEYIHYNSRDEVGELVRQYNRMIDELGESAAKLARSERELAWREMARQIAHEIKNPLTPMKLNVQQLFKWWKDETPDFSSRLEKFTVNQIEYIDNLSSIASAFSYFARLPGAEPAEVDVLTQLRTSLEMFGHSDEATITLDSGNISKAVIFADKEHLNGIFTNLLKNAIQAMPTGVKGLIKISLSASFDKVLISFRDNGVGIPEELKPKLFTPNFTTKSSGMGLGLSIVKRYVETAAGTIWFESERDRGTEFFIELPLLYTVERLDKKGM